MTSPFSKLSLLEEMSRHLTSQEQEKKSTFIIGVGGATASGKTTVCKIITQLLADSRVAVLTQDSFYRNLSEEELENVADYNFDHPDAFDLPFMCQVLSELKRGKNVRIPHYDYSRNVRSTEDFYEIGNVDVVIFEGILTLYYPAIRDFLDLKVFVWMDSDICLSRRILRDIEERGRTVGSVLKQYEKHVKPAHEEFVYPSKSHADIIMPRGASNTVAMGLIVQVRAHRVGSCYGSRMKDWRMLGVLTAATAAYQARAWAQARSAERGIAFPGKAAH